MRLCLAAALLMPAAAMAQGNPGPYGRLFGRQPAGSGKDTTVVEGRAGIGAQYNTALLPLESSDIATTPTGVGAGGSAGLVLEHNMGRWSTNLRGGVAREQYFNQPGTFGINRYSADGSVRVPITDRLDAQASAGYTYSPSFQYFRDFAPSNDVVIDNTFLPFSPYAVAMLANETVDLQGTLDARLAKGSTLSASVSKHQTHFAEEPASDYDSLGYGVRWSQRITRGFGAHAGYQREEIDSVSLTGLAYVHESVDVGVDFSHAFSLSRRTTLGFATSTSIIKQTGYDQQFRLNGNVTFAKFFRRTWSVGATASRSTEFTPGFVEPLYTDSAGAYVSGMFSKRVDFAASVGGGRGAYAFTGRSGFDTVSATTQLSFALNRYFQTYAQYVAFLSEVPRGTTTLRLPTRTGRQLVTIGISTYVPVYRKVRQGQ